MPKIISRGVISTEKNSTVAQHNLVTYYCLCGQLLLVLGALRSESSPQCYPVDTLRAIAAAMVALLRISFSSVESQSFKAQMGFQVT